MKTASNYYKYLLQTLINQHGHGAKSKALPQGQGPGIQNPGFKLLLTMEHTWKKQFNSGNRIEDQQDEQKQEVSLARKRPRNMENEHDFK